MLSSPRLVPILKGVIVVCVVGLIVLAGLFVRFVISGGLADTTPRARRSSAACSQPRKPSRPTRRTPTRESGLLPPTSSATALGRRIEQAQLAIRLEPKNPAAYYVLGLAQTKLGRTTPRSSRSRRPPTPRVSRLRSTRTPSRALARAYERAGNDKKADDGHHQGHQLQPRELAAALRARPVLRAQEELEDGALRLRLGADLRAATTSGASTGSTRSPRTHPKELKEIQKASPTQTPGSARRAGLKRPPRPASR